MKFDKRILNIVIIIVLSSITFWWTSFIFHLDMAWNVLATIIGFRILASVLIFKDFSLSWSKSTQKTFLIKTIVVGTPAVLSMIIFYKEVRLAFIISEASFYLVALSLLMYGYYYYINRSRIPKTKSLVIYGAGKAGNKLEDEFRGSEYKVKYFVDDDKILQGRSIDGIRVISKQKLKELIGNKYKYDLLVIAMPSADKNRIKEIHENLSSYFKQIKILPTIEEILRDKNFSAQLKDISVEDLLARHPKDLDKKLSKNL
jgi:FlaA1/EpsC-like NDP-sugar epimerase